MRTFRYLNGVLTVIAVLLTLNLWTMWQGEASPTGVAAPNAAKADGLANAGAQRMQMIGQLKKVNVQLNDLKQMLSSGQITVQVNRPAAPGDEGAPDTQDAAARDRFGPAGDRNHATDGGAEPQFHLERR